MIQIHASYKKSEHNGDTGSGSNIWCNRFVLFLNPKTFFSYYIFILPEAQKSGAPAAAPLPPRPEPDSRTDPQAPLCHSLAVPDLPPGYAGNFRQTFSQLCSLEAGELVALLCGRLLITAEAVRSEQNQSLFVWKNTVLFVSIVCLFKVDTLVTGHSARSMKSS